MRDYETVFVLIPTLEEKESEAEIAAVTDLITSSGGTIIEIDRWGRRRLAYEIRKVHEGIYTLIRFRAGSDVPREIERRFRINERVLRHMTVISEGPLPSPRPETSAAAGTEGEPARPTDVPSAGSEGASTEHAMGATGAPDTTPAETADGSSRP